MYIDEDFEINAIRPKFLDRGSFKKIRKRANLVYSKVVHNVKLPLTCSEFTMHMQIQI